MNIFLAIVMGPALGFMLYALAQFWLEERRLRKQSGWDSKWSVTPLTTSSGAQREHVIVAGIGKRNVVAITQSASRRSVERDVA